MYRDPTREDEIVYVAFNAQLFAFNKASGVIAWKQRFDTAGGELCVHVEADVVFAACANNVAAFDPATGAVRWTTRLPLADLHAAVMLVDASGIYVSLGGETACLDRDDGAIRWSDRLEGTGYGPPTVAVRGRSVRVGDRGD